MTASITEFLFGNVNTIAIPITSDSIFLLPIMIGFGLIISCSQYIFKELKEREILVLSTNHVKEQLEIEESVQEASSTEKPLISKLSAFSTPQLAGLGSIALLAFGGTSFFILEANNQNLPQILKTSELRNTLEVQSTKSDSSISFLSKEMSNTSRKEIKKISYLSPSFSKLNRSQNKEYAITKPMKIKKFGF